MPKLEFSVRTKADPAIYDVAVVVKALDILDALANGGPLGLTEIALLTGASKPSSFRILSTMESRGFVVKDGSTRKYLPGAKLIGIASALVSGVDLVRSARPSMVQLHERYGETVNLGVLDGSEVQYLEIIESPRGLRMSARIGDRDPIHSTALGRAILSTLDPDEAERLLASANRKRRTPRTITEMPDLVAELARSSARGYAFDNQENEVGARCVSAAILGADGQPVGALSVSGPSARLSLESLDMIGEDLLQATRQIQVRMGVATLVPGSNGPD
jgi:DNA-binding IclR family transcriptional regulator